MTFYRQETGFTCGPASIRNCMLSIGYNFSERKIRKLTGSDRKSGTNERMIVRALKALGFGYKVVYNKSESAFKQRLIYNLKKNNKLIILTEHEGHWISVVGYQSKHLKVIDPQESKVKQLTPKELAKWCLNFNKRTKKTYYYGIIIINPD
ncbi:MAG: C39 family peptidase [Ignavibacteria bacterium]